MKYVESSRELPFATDQAIRDRLKRQIDSMDASELRIAAKSEASFRAFISDLFRSIAQLFGYIVGTVVGFVEDIGRGIKKGWQSGFDAGRGTW